MTSGLRLSQDVSVPVIPGRCELLTWDNSPGYQQKIGVFYDGD